MRVCVGVCVCVCVCERERESAISGIHLVEQGWMCISSTHIISHPRALAPHCFFFIQKVFNLLLQSVSLHTNHRIGRMINNLKFLFSCTNLILNITKASLCQCLLHAYKRSQTLYKGLPSHSQKSTPPQLVLHNLDQKIKPFQN